MQECKSARPGLLNNKGPRDLGWAVAEHAEGYKEEAREGSVSWLLAEQLLFW